MTIENYTTYHVNFDGIPAAWRYCERRMLFAKSETIGTNSTYESIYRKFILWVEEYSAHLAIVDGENANENNTAAPLETYVISLGTVYVTQRNVETYFTQVVVNLAGTSTASLKKKISGLSWFRQNVENRAARTGIQYSSVIVQCIRDQQVSHVARSNRTYAVTDPHKGLKDVFSDDDVVKLVDSI